MWYLAYVYLVKKWNIGSVFNAPWVSSVLTVSILGLPWCLKFLSTRATSHLLTSLIGVLRCVKLWYYVLLSLFWQYLNQFYNSFLQDFIGLQKTASIVSLFVIILYLFFTLKQYSYQPLILTCNEFFIRFCGVLYES